MPAKSSKPKILFVGHSPHMAGAEYSLLRLLKVIHQEIEAQVLAPGKGEFEKQIRVLKIPFHHLELNYAYRSKNDRRDLRPRFLVHLMKNVQEALGQLEKPDVVHSNTFFIFEGALLAAHWQVPHIWNLREIIMDSPSWEPLWEFAEMFEKMDELSDQFITVSKALKQRLPTKLQKKTTAQINGYDEVPSLSQAEARAYFEKEFGIDKGTKVILSIGNFIPEKGHDYLLETVREVVKERTNVCFLWMGAKHQTHHRIAQMLENENLSSYVVMPGHVDRAHRLMKGADLYLLASTTEACPTVVLEARLASVPVIARRNGGVEEILEHGGGLLIDLEDGRAFAEAVKAYLKGETSIPPAKSNPFTMAQMRETYLGVYEKAMSTKVPGAERKKLFDTYQQMAASSVKACRHIERREALEKGLVTGKMLRAWRKITR